MSEQAPATNESTTPTAVPEAKKIEATEENKDKSNKYFFTIIFSQKKNRGNF